MDKSNIETSMSMYQPEWRKEDEQRVINMERWYILDGRHRPDHPKHGLYTGLAEIGEELDSFDEDDAA